MNLRQGQIEQALQDPSHTYDNIDGGDNGGSYQDAQMDSQSTWQSQGYAPQSQQQVDYRPTAAPPSISISSMLQSVAQVVGDVDDTTDQAEESTTAPEPEPVPTALADESVWRMATFKFGEIPEEEPPAMFRR